MVCWEIRRYISLYLKWNDEMNHAVVCFTWHSLPWSPGNVSRLKKALGFSLDTCTSEEKEPYICCIHSLQQLLDPWCCGCPEYLAAFLCQFRQTKKNLLISCFSFFPYISPEDNSFKNPCFTKGKTTTDCFWNKSCSILCKFEEHLQIWRSMQDIYSRAMPSRSLLWKKEK